MLNLKKEYKALETIFVSHGDIYIRSKKIAERIRDRVRSAGGITPLIYPVPRGGVPVAYALKAFLPEAIIMPDPDAANIVVDDVIDSGTTRNRYKEKPFFSLYNKLEEDKGIGWLVFPWEVNEQASIEDSVTRQLQYIGEDPNREGLKDTPKRVVRSWGELFCGYKADPREVFRTFDGEEYDQIVLLKNIELFSMCEHHVLPFFGEAHIAYIPNKRVIGVSKLARLLEIYARRLQIQERLGGQITSALMEYLSPKGAACIISAKHLCMCTRGVNKQHSIMTTSSLRGCFLDDRAVREELLRLIGI